MNLTERAYSLQILACTKKENMKTKGTGFKEGEKDFLMKTRINMEVQIIDYKDWPERSLFYSGKTLTSQLRKGEPYTKIHKCIHIGILDFKLYPESKEYFTEFYLMDSREHRRVGHVPERQRGGDTNVGKEK